MVSLFPRGVARRVPQALRPSSGALASFLSTGIKKDGELLGVFCTQMPPESKPVTLSEMQPVLEKVTTTMSTAESFYMAGAAASHLFCRIISNTLGFD